MNADIKAKWVAALRSGEYVQGTTQLRDSEENRHCCLGVLCDLYVREGKAQWCGDDLLGVSADVPHSVRVWAGLNHADPKVQVGQEVAHITAHNDGLNRTAPKTFAQIADAIEEQL